MAQMAREVAEDCLGPNSVENSTVTNMGAEDFSCFLEHVAGCYVRIGAWNGVDETAPAHSCRFNFAEGALLTGASYLTSLAIAAGKMVLKQEF